VPDPNEPMAMSQTPLNDSGQSADVVTAVQSKPGTSRKPTL
jgi:hypothetical protein